MLTSVMNTIFIGESIFGLLLWIFLSSIVCILPFLLLLLLFSEYLDVSATVFTAIAARFGDSDIVHVQTNERRVLDAYVRLSDEEEFNRVDFDVAFRWIYSGKLEKYNPQKNREHNEWRIQRVAQQPPPPLTFDRLCFLKSHFASECFKIYKALIARESVKKRLKLSGAPAKRDFGFALVMCVHAHNPLRAP